MKPETCSYIPTTTYCSKDCYKRYVKKFIWNYFIWNYYYKMVKKNFIDFIKSLYKFVNLLYKYYIKDILINMFKISIILIAYFTLSEIIYLVETYIK